MPFKRPAAGKERSLRFSQSPRSSQPARWEPKDEGGVSELIHPSSREATIPPVRLLVVEDEKKMADLLARGLREEGHAVDVAGTGEDAPWMAGAAAYEAIVLDVMLPG